MPREEIQPTNAVLNAKLDGLKEIMEERFKENSASHHRINTHLEKLNGQVIKNTSFRWKITAYLAIAGVGLPILISVLIDKVF